MLNVTAIGTKGFVIGFKSAGVNGYVVDNSTQAKDKIKELVNNDNTAIILLGESVAIDIIDYVEKISATKTIPSILVLRDDNSNLKIGKDSIQRYVEQATGMKSMVNK